MQVNTSISKRYTHTHTCEWYTAAACGRFCRPRRPKCFSMESSIESNSVIRMVKYILRIARLEEEQAEVVGGMAQKLQTEALKYPVAWGPKNPRKGCQALLTFSVACFWKQLHTRPYQPYHCHVPSIMKSCAPFIVSAGSWH